MMSLLILYVSCFLIIFTCSGILTYTDIQKEQHHKKRRFTDFIFRRIPGNAEHNGGNSTQALSTRGTKRQTQRASCGYPPPQVPTVRASLPGEENQVKKHTSPTTRAVQNLPGPSLVRQASGSGDTLHPRSIPAVVPRRFHLTTSASSLSLRHQTPSSGIKKHKKSRRNDLAVFVEKSKERLRPKTPRRNSAATGQRRSTTTSDSMPTPVEVQPEGDRPRRRPNATAAERKWRTENWGDNALRTAPRELPPRKGRTINESSNNWDYSSVELAEQLQQVALQESGYMNWSSGTTGNVLSSPYAKVKPKAPPPRYRDREGQTNVDMDHDSEAETDAEDDTQYVYDTFVRQVASSNHAVPTTSTDPLQGLNPGNSGILVVDEKYEKLWDTYGEDDDSDKDWNSEEEDENGRFYFQPPE